MISNNGPVDPPPSLQIEIVRRSSTSPSPSPEEGKKANDLAKRLLNQRFSPQDLKPRKWKRLAGFAHFCNGTFLAPARFLWRFFKQCQAERAFIKTSRRVSNETIINLKKMEQLITFFELKEDIDVKPVAELGKIVDGSKDVQKLAPVQERQNINDLKLMVRNCSVVYARLLKDDHPKTGQEGARMQVEETVKESELKRELRAIFGQLKSKIKGRNHFVPCNEEMKKVQKAFESAVSRANRRLPASGRISKKTFHEELAVERGLTCPRTLTYDIPIDQGRTLTNRMTNGSLEIGVRYLQELEKLDIFPKDQFQQQIAYNKKIVGANGFRPSKLKEGEAFQGATLNFRWEEVVNKNGNVLFAEPRSGAFSTHGRKPARGLAHLQSVFAKNMQDQEFLNIVKELEVGEGASFSEQREALKNEIRIREAYLTAQALPKILMSLKHMIQNEKSLKIADETGSFLYAEQSFLSHLFEKEKSMLEDMQGVMEHLQKCLVIELDSTVEEGGERVSIDKGRIILSLKKPEEPAIMRNVRFSLTCPLFSQGINERQSMHRVVKYDPLQEEINAKGLNALINYYKSAKGLLENEQWRVLQELIEHFSSGETLPMKDMKGVDLIKKATTAIGGIRGENCKSGKDRTSIGVCHAMAISIQEGFELDEEQTMAVFHSLLAGTSYTLTGQNTGEDGFAFDPWQWGFLPKNLRPQLRLCKKAET